jgi:hypothetical protein
MNRHEATILHGYILRSYHTEDSFLKSLTEKLNANSIEDWALTIEELMELPSADPNYCFMRQIEKLAFLLGCSPEDSKKVALQAFADMVTKEHPKNKS